MTEQVALSKGKGKGVPPLPRVKAEPPKAMGVVLKCKVRESDSALTSVPFTVVTRADGSREIEKPDGTVEQLPKDRVEGQWGVGSTSVPFTTANSGPSDISALTAFVREHPEMKEYQTLFMSGFPVEAIRSRIIGAHGLSLATAFCEALGVTEEETPSELQGSPAALHGRLGDTSWAAPRLVTRCVDLARPGYNSVAAHEFLDMEEVLQAKVKQLAAMVRRAKRLVVYAGAGLSTASGITDVASKANNRGVLAKLGPNIVVSPFDAEPNLGHRSIAALARAGLVWRFIQQNHDGLPQKAGVPQRLINEIHGGWFDPSNPVVSMKGQLREDLFKDLMLCERETDLVLALGSSLAGMNADRLVATCADRAQRVVPPSGALGSVIITLQRTPHDANSSLRIFAPLNDVLSMLATELGIEVLQSFANLDIPHVHRPLGSDVDVFSVPYDESGKLQGERRLLDLRQGAKLVISVGKDVGKEALMCGKNSSGHYRIGIKLNPATRGQWDEMRLLGSWWAAAAVAGDLPQLPLVTPSKSVTNGATLGADP